MVNAQAGYDYLLDPSNSIAILASYGKINYTGTGTTTIGNGDSTTDYLGALAYGRKITGRLAFQVAAGPQEIHFAGPGGVGNFHALIRFGQQLAELPAAPKRGFLYVTCAG